MQERSETRLRRRDPALRAWPKQKKHWLKRCGAGLALPRERPTAHCTCCCPKLPPEFPHDFLMPYPSFFFPQWKQLLPTCRWRAWLLPLVSTSQKAQVRLPYRSLTIWISDAPRGEHPQRKIPARGKCLCLWWGKSSFGGQRTQFELGACKSKCKKSSSFTKDLLFYNFLFLFCSFFFLQWGQKCKTEFDSVAELIEHYTEVEDSLPCLLSCARVNHCYEWEEFSNKHATAKPRKSPTDKAKVSSAHGKSWVWTLRLDWRLRPPTSRGSLKVTFCNFFFSLHIYHFVL